MGADSAIRFKMGLEKFMLLQFPAKMLTGLDMDMPSNIPFTILNAEEAKGRS